MKPLILISMALMLVTGCASVPEAEEKDTAQLIDTFIEEQELSSVERVSSFKFGGWTVLDSSHLILEKRINQYLLIKLSNRCSELKFANVLGLDRLNDNALHSRYDSVFAMGDIPRKCFIESIYEISKEQRKTIVESLKS